ncbi:MAG: hypothetical protein A2Z21_03470 [Candidatus Fraserbacteria bacterium RBG_16_55_9]|uniref:Uncharacterized protein n=1 Tax=Fraserbacteria sp. (strain RBG_16_55_9) TaxID=1817864 RepID=A0A1F5URJ6_FRAXR|nr:MAG: hypothetical protein A2Z21_03470 [Candidatus Fraserbacteria bacterium RBG_16_55_9]
MPNDHPALWQALHHLQYQQLLKEAEEWRLLGQGQRRPTGSRLHQKLVSSLGDLLVELGSRLKQFERPVL